MDGAIALQPSSIIAGSSLGLLAWNLVRNQLVPGRAERLLPPIATFYCPWPSESVSVSELLILLESQLAISDRLILTLQSLVTRVQILDRELRQGLGYQIRA